MDAGDSHPYSGLSAFFADSTAERRQRLNGAGSSGRIAKDDNPQTKKERPQ
jgi:hypothetical protein